MRPAIKLYLLCAFAAFLEITLSYYLQTSTYRNGDITMHIMRYGAYCTAKFSTVILSISDFQYSFICGFRRYGLQNRLE